jgi:hypothetical protein
MAQAIARATIGSDAADARGIGPGERRAGRDVAGLLLR